MSKTGAKKKRAVKKKPDMFAELHALIVNYRDCAIADSWSGGGDPLDAPMLKLELELAELKLVAHIGKMRREFTGEHE